MYKKNLYFFILLLIFIVVKFNDIELFTNNIIFSIIIPLYNNENYIEGTIMSVINQSFKNFELIVIDDKSTDNSYNKVLKLKKKFSNIRLFKNEENIGAYKTQNKGISLSRGKYITVLGSDDRFDRDRLKEDYHGLLKKNVVISKFERREENSDKILQSYLGESMITYDKLLIEKIGPYLNCRFGGDTEFLRRIKLILGNDYIFKNNKTLYYAIIKKDKKNLTKIHNKEKRKKFIEYYKILHKNYNNKISDEDNQKLIKLLPFILISPADHKKNLQYLKIY